MKIEINKIQQQGLQLTETWQARDYDLETREIHFIQPLVIKVHANKEYGHISLKINVVSKMQLVCVRCLENYDLDVFKEFVFHYSLKDNKQEINPTDKIREEIILGYPIKALCSRQCKGLCPHCGQNLNIGKCKCTKKEFVKKIL